MDGGVAIYLLLALLEGLLVLSGLCAYLWFRLNARQVSQPRDGPPTRAVSAQTTAPPIARLDIVHYLQRERERTLAELKTVGTDNVRNWLQLRTSVLDAEIGWAQQDDRPSLFWKALASRLEQLVRSHDPTIRAGSVAVHGDDSPDLSDIVHRQQRTIDFLKEYLSKLMSKAGQIPAPGATAVETEFNKLENTNRELQYCVTILEDENQFLRDQVAALLRLDQNAAE